MDVSSLLASTSQNGFQVAQKDVPITVDAGLLSVFDLNELDEESYRSNPESCLLHNAKDGVQALLNTLLGLPRQKSPDGPLVLLPAIETPLPRAKPLPKPKPLTKWEQFAKTKGIEHKKRDRKVWDEEKQEWVNRWGWNGKNKELEEQWAVEVKEGKPDDYDPAKEARDQRKSRISKNEKQRLANLARAQGGSKEERKAELRAQALQTKISTASMGKFDKRLEGEPKLRGQKRKFEPNEDVTTEKSRSLAILSKLDSAPAAKRSRKDDGGGGKKDDVLNVRKAIRSVTKGKGVTSFSGKTAGARGGGKKGRPIKGKGKR